VEQLPTLEAACAAFEQPVCLILVDTEFLHQIDSRAGDLLRFHPAAPTVLLQNDSRTPVSVQDVFDLKIVRSVLPMDLKLDVWLSVVRLMLRGGIFSVSCSSHMQGPSVKGRIIPYRLIKSEHGCRFRCDGRADRAGISDSRNGGARLQNKIIAATLRLSEHTVRSSAQYHHQTRRPNRTEAAAVFHQRKDAFYGGMERVRPSRVSQSSP
jgi:hypothetical protein